MSQICSRDIPSIHKHENTNYSTNERDRFQFAKWMICYWLKIVMIGKDYVGKTVLNSTSEVLTEILSPFSKLLEGYVIYKALD